MQQSIQYLILIVTLLLAGCSADDGSQAASTQNHTAPPDLAEVRHWFYMIDVNLEDDMVDEMVESDYGLIVLDFIPSESNNTDFPMADVIDRLHNAEQPKLVIAYIDIGQAESFRTYWQDGWEVGNPRWITGKDPDGWEENYPVAYWYDEWQAIWLGEDGYIARIVDLGFDGIYLDWVEAYSDTAVMEIADEDGVDATQEMVWWVEGLAETGRALDEDFIVIGQNAAELVESDEYVTVVDAISQEQAWFDGSADNDPGGDCPLPRTEDDVESDEYVAMLSEDCLYLYETYTESTLHVSSESYLYYLEMARDKGLIVFTVDYAVEDNNIEWVTAESRDYGFVPFVSNRALDQFVEPLD